MLAETGNNLITWFMFGNLCVSALYIAITVYTNFITAETGAAIINRLTSAALFTTLAVTLWATLLIAYRIYSGSNLILNRKRPRFYNVVEMIIQTSFIYSLALVPCALLPEVPKKLLNLYTLIAAENYLNAILCAITVRRTTLHYTSWDAHKV